MKRADGPVDVAHGEITDRRLDTESGRVIETTYRVTVQAIQKETLDLPDPHVQVHIHLSGAAVTEQQLRDVVEDALRRAHRYRR
jgi:hypothetical protein